MPDESAPLALQRQYQARFAGSEAYRASVWKELSAFFSRYVPAGATVADCARTWQVADASIDVVPA
ncbi:hypothetical protein LPW11_17825 [Geomonas sp. RF6]|uniref:hypothetical protein n=1 Tax=Geomonas sp. RF6 TaxID=2897342 RepID=UPI001E3FCBA0|nr:hypothetical protein [Geomonas sp. RF6]UFS69741.1 hypothetical protein LPW11_17825 [Geomonas sp. RF6]